MSHYKSYLKYKDSGVEWLGEVPEHWMVLPIKRLVSAPVTDGPHETPEFLDDGIPFVSAEAVAGGYIDFTKIRGYISHKDHLRYSQKYHPKNGDIYVVKSGATTGVSAIVETDIDFNIWSPLAVIRCNYLALPKFILNCIRSANLQNAIALSWSFGTQQNIGMGVLENIQVPVPEINEQQAIAAFLDRETTRIDALVAKKTGFIELLREKRQALITHAVTKGLDPNVKMKDSGVEWLGEVPEHWKIVSIGRAIVFQRGFDLPDQLRIEGQIPVVSSSGIIAYHNESRCNGPGIITGRYGTIGEFHYLESPFWPLNTSLFSVNCHNNHVRWLWYAMQAASHLFIVNSAKSAVPGVDRNDIHVEKCAIPPYVEQEKITIFLDRETHRIDALIEKTNRSIDLLKERRAALITAAVTGQIDVRGVA